MNSSTARPPLLKLMRIHAHAHARAYVDSSALGRTSGAREAAAFEDYAW